MKIFAFTDIHGSKQAIRKIKSAVNMQRPEIIVCCGDISNFENNLPSLLREINNLKRPVVIVHGNHESESTFLRLKHRFKNIAYIHNSSYVLNNTLFVGYGGGGFEINDLEFKKSAKKLEGILKNNKNKKFVLVTHGPPYNTKLDEIKNSHFGSKPLRRFIEEKEIELTVCGHLHENFGKEDKIKHTKIVNPGCLGRILVV